MDDFVVDNQFPAAVIDDQSSDTASSVCKGTVDLVVQAALIDDGKALLDLSTLGHADEPAIIANVQNPILPVDRAQHALHDDRVGRVADKGALFVKLTGEEIDTQVSKLAGLGRGRDPDDLARTTLQDHQITHTDEVAWDGDSVNRVSSARLNEADALTDAFTNSGRAGFIVADNHFLLVIIFMVMMVVMVEGMEDAVGGALDATAEAVVMAFVVVIAHIVSGAFLGRSNLFSVDFDVLSRRLATIIYVVGRVGAAAVLAFCDI